VSKFEAVTEIDVSGRGGTGEDPGGGGVEREEEKVEECS